MDKQSDISSFTSSQKPQEAANKSFEKQKSSFIQNSDIPPIDGQDEEEEFDDGIRPQFPLPRNKNPAVENMYPKPKNVTDNNFKQIMMQFEKGYKNGEFNENSLPVKSQQNSQRQNAPTNYKSPSLGAKKNDHESGKTSPSKLDASDLKITNEVDWFGFQTQLRKIVYELVEPTVKRALLSENSIFNLQEENTTLKRKIDELEFVFQKAQKRSVTNDDISRKIHEQDQTRRLAEVKLRGEIDLFKTQLEQFKQRLQVVETEAVRYQTQTQLQQQEVQAVIDTFTLTRKQLNEQIMDGNEQVKSWFITLNERIEEFDVPIKRCEHFLENQKELLKHSITDLELMKKQFEQAQNEILRLDKDKMSELPFKEFKTQISNSIKCNQQDIEHLMKELQMTDNYLEKYLPFKTLNYIHDALVSFLDKKEMLKVFDYLAVVFQNLETSIANDSGKSSLIKRDYFIPALDLAYIQMQRRMQKLATDNSSGVGGNYGIGSSQRSNSLISGVAGDGLSDAKNKLSKIRSNRKHLQKNTSGQNPDNISQSTNQTRLLRKPAQYGNSNIPMSGKTPKSKQTGLNSRRTSKISNIKLSSTSKQQNMLKLNQIQVTNPQPVVSDYNQMMSQSANFGRKQSIKPQSIQILTSQTQNQPSMAQIVISSATNTPSQRVVTKKSNSSVIPQPLPPHSTQNDFQEAISNVVITELGGEGDSPSFGKRAVKLRNELDNQNMTPEYEYDSLKDMQVNESLIKTKDDLKNIQQALSQQQSHVVTEQSPLQRTHTYFAQQQISENQEKLRKLMTQKVSTQEINGSLHIPRFNDDQQEVELLISPSPPITSSKNILDGELTPNQSFQGATFHKSPTRQSFIHRQSSIDILKKGGNQVNEVKREEGNIIQPMRIPPYEESSDKEQLRIQLHQAQSEAHKDDLVYSSQDASPNKKLELDEDHSAEENEQDYDDEDSQSDDDEDDESGSDESFSGNRIIGKKIRKLKASINQARVDFQDQADNQTNLNDQVQDELKKIKEQIEINESLWREDSKFIKNYINESLNSEKSKLKKELTDKYDDITEKLQDQINDMVIRRKREHSDTLFELERLKDVGNQQLSRIQVQSFKIDNYNELLQQILESLLVVNILINQDEKDRKSLSLVGMNTVGGNLGNETGLPNNRMQEQPSVKLDKQCMNCSGQNTTIIKSAFKMACLAYQPKEIEFSGQKIPKDLLAKTNQAFVEKLLSSYSQMLRQQDQDSSNINSRPKDSFKNESTILPEISEIKRTQNRQSLQSLVKSQSDGSNDEDSQVEIRTSKNSRGVNAVNITARQFLNESSESNLHRPQSNASRYYHKKSASFINNILSQGYTSQQREKQLELPPSIQKYMNIQKKTDALLHDRNRDENDKVKFDSVTRASFEIVSNRAKTPMLSQNATSQNYRRLQKQRLNELSTQITNRAVSITSFNFFRILRCKTLDIMFLKMRYPSLLFTLKQAIIRRLRQKLT